VVSYWTEGFFFHPHTIHLIWCSDGWLAGCWFALKEPAVIKRLSSFQWFENQRYQKIGCWVFESRSCEGCETPPLTTAGCLMSDPRSDNRPTLCPSPPPPLLLCLVLLVSSSISQVKRWRWWWECPLLAYYYYY
jgi:hypothetical protein